MLAPRADCMLSLMFARACLCRCALVEISPHISYQQSTAFLVLHSAIACCVYPRYKAPHACSAVHARSLLSLIRRCAQAAHGAGIRAQHTLDVDLHDSSIAAPHQAIGDALDVVAHLAQGPKSKTAVEADERAVLALVVTNAQELGPRVAEGALLADPACCGEADEQPGLQPPRGLVSPRAGLPPARPKASELAHLNRFQVSHTCGLGEAVAVSEQVAGGGLSSLYPSVCTRRRRKRLPSVPQKLHTIRRACGGSLDLTAQASCSCFNFLKGERRGLSLHTDEPCTAHGHCTAAAVSQEGETVRDHPEGRCDGRDGERETER